MVVKVMVVEDSNVMRFLLTSFLKECDAEVVCETPNGDEAIDLYKEHRPDLVFLDMIIQGKKGLEVLKELHQVNPEVNVIICSSLGDEHNIRDAAELGIFDYLVKPMSKIQIKEVIDHYARIKDFQGEKKKVLIADDSYLARGILSRALIFAGYEVISEASNGDEMLDHFKKFHPDIIIVDLVMPEKGGIQAIKEVRSIDKNVKIIVCTALSGVDFVKESFLSGADDLIVKPFTKLQMKKALEHHR
jgi:two-component system, chemotaxis family, chemotaxis protein CheY